LEGEMPATVIAVPGMPAPGAKMPPLLMSVFPTVPMPPSAPPIFTRVRLELVIEPLTIRVPPLTSVVPV
jgi:hypothetical protein